MAIWNKYKMIKEINSEGNIKTYKAQIEPIIKEITPRNRDEYDNILYNLQNYENSIYEIIEENNKIYVVLLNNNINLDNINLKNEGYKYNNSPITKHEINELFSKEKALCRIISDNFENNSKSYGTGFFVKLNNNKYGLLTNNHIINNIEIGNTIHFYYLSKYKKIEITKNREVYTDKKLDYTFIEIFKEDNIKDFFKIYSHNIKNLKNNYIYIMQYPILNEISFSFGKIKLIDNNNKIRYNASTSYGSSGSPIILRCNDNLIIGMHNGYFSQEDNFGTTINSIITDIQQKSKKNEIICTYNKKEKESIDILYDFSLNIANGLWNDEEKKLYEEAKSNINEKNIEIYINNKKIKFNYKYKSNKIGQIKVKFKLNKILSSSSYMFNGCSSLVSIDLSSLNTNHIFDMSWMFSGCCSLESINLSSFNTNKVTNMSYMFDGCSSLTSIDLSSFDTNKVNNMNYMFDGCCSLTSIDLSSFDTKSVTNMSYMFHENFSLKSLNLISFNTNNVTDMSYMFDGCSSLESINLSSFNIKNVINMSFMFYNCSTLKSLDLSSFITNNDTDISWMFNGCSSLKKQNIKLNENEKRILEYLDISQYSKLVK